jgi:tetratricopeptide (TPR) repeat protein
MKTRAYFSVLSSIVALAGWLGQTNSVIAKPDNELLDRIRSFYDVGTLQAPPDAFRGESDEDRVHAAALYSTARLYERKKQIPKALRLYQRSARYGEGNLKALRRAIVLARQQNRHGETARYATLLVRHDLTDSLSILRAFVYLREQGEVDKALQLYERATTDGQPNNREPAWIEVHKLAGQLYLSSEKYKPAAAAFSIIENVFAKPDEFGLDKPTVKLLKGNDPAALYRVIAEAYLKSDQFEQARAAFEIAEKESPSQGRKLYFEARLHAAANEIQHSEDELHQYFDAKLSDQGSGPYDLLEELLEKQNKKNELNERLKKIVEADPENAAIAYFLANKLLAAERWDDALALFEKHFDDKPQARAFRGLALIHHKTKHADKFLDTVSELIDRVASLSVVKDEVKAVTEDDAFLKSVLDEANRRMADQPESDKFNTSLAAAEIAAAAKNWDVAKTHYEHAFAADPTKKAAIYELWGMHLIGAEQYERGTNVFRRAIDENAAPGDKPIFHHYLAGTLAMQDKHDKALEAARQAARKAPDSPEFLARVAWILYRAKRRDEARDVYSDLVRQFDKEFGKSGVRDIVRESRLTLSHLNALKENHDEAEELLEEVLDEYPLDIGAYNDLGYLWADRGVHLNRALSMIQAACDAEPENHAYRDSLGWALYRLERYEDAKKELEFAASDEDPDGVILDHLGDVYGKLGDKDAARKSWQRAVMAFEKSEDQDMADTVRKKLNRKDN